MAKNKDNTPQEHNDIEEQTEKNIDPAEIPDDIDVLIYEDAGKTLDDIINGNIEEAPIDKKERKKSRDIDVEIKEKGGFFGLFGKKKPKKKPQDTDIKEPEQQEVEATEVPQPETELPVIPPEPEQEKPQPEVKPSEPAPASKKKKKAEKKPEINNPKGLYSSESSMASASKLSFSVSGSDDEEDDTPVIPENNELPEIPVVKEVQPIIREEPPIQEKQSVKEDIQPQQQETSIPYEAPVIDEPFKEFMERYDKGEVDSADTSDESAQNDEDEIISVYEEDEEPEVKPVPKKKKKKKRRRRRSNGLAGGLVLTTLILGISVILAVTVITVGKDLMGIDKSQSTYIFEIEEGQTVDDIAENLKKQGLINVPIAFKLVSRLQNSDSKYVVGQHQISPSMGYASMIDELTTVPESIQREHTTVMFPEGITLIDAGRKLEEAGVCSREQFIFFFNAGNLGYDFEKYLPTETSNLKFYKMEGYLFPDTYEFYLNEDPEVVCRKIYDNFNKKFKPEYYTRLSELNMTLDEVITLASIIQAESATPEQMKMISSVFHNRLNNPAQFPLLQSDPTRKYVEDVITPNIDIESQAMNDAYNTYTGAGLPPGAICNPGIEAIEAALYPADTNYYFFCANIDTKEVYYATTNEEHNENLVKAGLK